MPSADLPNVDVGVYWSIAEARRTLTLATSTFVLSDVDVHVSKTWAPTQAPLAMNGCCPGSIGACTSVGWVQETCMQASA